MEIRGKHDHRLYGDKHCRPVIFAAPVTVWDQGILEVQSAATFFLHPVKVYNGGIIHTTGCTDFKADLLVSNGGQVMLTQGAADFDRSVSVLGRNSVLRAEGQGKFKDRVIVQEGTLQARYDSIWKRMPRTSRGGRVDPL